MGAEQQAEQRAERVADYVAEFELDDDTIDEHGVEHDVVLWRVGMVRIRDRWDELQAAHPVRQDATAAEVRDAQDAFGVDLVANSVIWEQYGDDPRTPLEPGDVAPWADEVSSDVWLALVDEAYRLSGPTGWEWATQRLRNAPQLRVELAVCREYRIPHSAFLAWPEDDQHYAIAELLESRQVCPGCGVPARAMSNPDAAVIEVDRCFWCVVRGQNVRDASEGEHPRVQIKHGY